MHNEQNSSTIYHIKQQLLKNWSQESKPSIPQDIFFLPSIQCSVLTSVHCLSSFSQFIMSCHILTSGVIAGTLDGELKFVVLCVSFINVNKLYFKSVCIQ